MLSTTAHVGGKLQGQAGTLVICLPLPNPMLTSGCDGGLGETALTTAVTAATTIATTATSVVSAAPTVVAASATTTTAIAAAVTTWNKIQCSID